MHVHGLWLWAQKNENKALLSWESFRIKAISIKFLFFKKGKENEALFCCHL